MKFANIIDQNYKEFRVGYQGCPQVIGLQFEDDEVIQVEGVQVSAIFIKSFLNNPPEGKFSFVREGNDTCITETAQCRFLQS